MKSKFHYLKAVATGLAAAAALCATQASAAAFKFQFTGFPDTFAGILTADPINGTNDYQITGVTGSYSTDSGSNTGTITGLSGGFFGNADNILFNGNDLSAYGLGFDTSSKGSISIFPTGGGWYGAQGESYFSDGTLSITTSAPEIDGGKLPLALLLTGVVALLARRRRALATA